MTCPPKHNYFGKSLIIINIYFPPAPCPDSLFDSLIENFGPILINNLFILHGDLNHVNTYPLSVIGLTDLVDFPTRLEAHLDHFLFPIHVLTAQRHAPLSASDHVGVLAISKNNCQARTRTLIRSTSHPIKMCNLDPENV